MGSTSTATSTSMSPVHVKAQVDVIGGGVPAPRVAAARIGYAGAMKRPELEASRLEGLAALAPPAAIARLVAIQQALATCGDPDVLAALAQAIPARVADLVPEVALALQEVARALVPYRPRIPDDVRALEPRLRTAWQRVAVAADDGACAAGLPEAELGHVVTGWSPGGVAAPAALLARLARAGDVRLHAIALRWIPGLVAELAITGPEAFDGLAPLVAGGDPAIRAEAIRMLARPWLLGLPPGAIRRREVAIRAALRDPEPAVAAAAIEAAGELAGRAWLAELVEDAGAPPASRATALGALGRLAEPADLDTALALAQEDPLRFGPGARTCLLEAHRHGVFLRDPHVAAVLALYDDHAGWTAEELIRVTYLARARLVELLAALPADDVRWIRRAQLLADSLGTGASGVLERLLEATLDPRIAAAAIDAAGRSPEIAEDARLLRWLGALPEVVIPVLRVKGGAGAVAQLRAIVEDPFTARPLRALAMDALWALEPDRPGLLRALSRRLGPHDAGLLDSKHLARRDATAAQLLAERAWDDLPHDAVDPLAQLTIYCEAGDLRFLPEVTRLFREVFRGYVRDALAGDFSIKRLLMPELEQQVFRYGRHLIDHGRSVRRWIASGPETGRDLVLLLVCDWLAEGPSDAVRVALLETAARHAPEGAVLRILEPAWRKGDANVRRAAIEVLVAAGDGARGLELSLGKLAAEASDPRLLCQALAALRTLRAAWAEPIVRAALARPEMAVKKEAADALAELGTPQSIPALINWLARHDNDSFRAGLVRALQRAAGPAYVAVIVDALEREPEARGQELLWQALAGQLTLATALGLARSAHPAHRALIDACLDRRVALAGATADELAAQLHRARLRPIEPKPDPARRLRLEGFSPQAARQLVATRTPELDAQILPVVRLGLADWLAWLGAEPDAPGAAQLVLDAADATHAEHAGALVELAGSAGIEPEAVAAFVERGVAGASDAPLKLRAIALVRGLARSAGLGGLRRYRLLGRLGAVRTLRDLEACLAECRVRPDVAAESRALLCEALAIPDARSDDPPALVELRDRARDWFRGEPTAGAWLAATVAARPLDLPVLPLPRPAAKPAFQPSSRDDLEALLQALGHRDDHERARVAQRILAWPDAHAAWPAVREAYLAGQVALYGDGLARVASTLTAWPAGERALALVPVLSERQVRAFAPAWLDAWAGGDADAGEWLRQVAQDRLLPLVVARARAGQFVFARLLRPSATPAIRALIELAAGSAPGDVAHLREAAAAVAPLADPGDPVDPIAGQPLDALVALIDQKGVDKGLAVRAVHALTAHKERSIEPLARLTRDRRPAVRSAALRALRVVASRERTLEATAAALELETRRDVALGLMASLGHGRYAPSLPSLLERLVDRDHRIRQGAHAALRAWGRDVIPALRHAAKRARPDRRAPFEALIAELE